jgi:hypothetical protein
MSKKSADECNKPSLLGMVAIAALAYLVAKNLPDIMRYIKISRM